MRAWKVSHRQNFKAREAMLMSSLAKQHARKKEHARCNDRKRANRTSLITPAED